MTSARAALLAAAGLAAALVAGSARADATKDQCIDANAKAQDLRRDHRLAAAREQLQICVDPACPGIIRTDCSRRLLELEDAQPTVLFDVSDASGALITGARVTVDGKPLARTDPGTSVALDPGEHKVTFEAVGFIPVTRTVVMLERDKGHHEHVVLAPVVVERPALPPAPVEDSAAHTRKIMGFTAAGAGVVGLVVGAIFGGLTLGEKSDQVGVCSAACSAAAHQQAESDHSAGVTDSTVATVGIVAGLALVGGGAALYFTAQPRVERETTPLGLTLSPLFARQGGGLSALGTF